MISQPCEFCALKPTLVPKNLVSNKFSWTKRAICKHKHIMKNKLTSGYRKRLSGSRADKQNVKNFPDFRLSNFHALTVRPLQYYLDGGILNRLYKSYFEFEMVRSILPIGQFCTSRRLDPGGLPVRCLLRVFFSEFWNIDNPERANPLRIPFLLA